MEPQRRRRQVKLSLPSSILSHVSRHAQLAQVSRGHVIRCLVRRALVRRRYRRLQRCQQAQDYARQEGQLHVWFSESDYAVLRAMSEAAWMTVGGYLRALLMTVIGAAESAAQLPSQFQKG